MDSTSEAVNIIRSYDDFMPYCKFQKEEHFDTYQIPLHGFKIEEFKVYVDDKKGTINIKGQRPMDGSRWSRFRQEFKISSDVYNTKNISAMFGNGVLSIRLPKKETSDDKSDPFSNKGLRILRLKWISQRIAIAVAVGVAFGGYVTFKYLRSTNI